MNMGHAIFKRMQRLQGGTGDVAEQRTPEQEKIDAMIAQKRLERMKQARMDMAPSRGRFIQPEIKPEPTSLLSPMGTALWDSPLGRMLTDWLDQRRQEEEQARAKRMGNIGQGAFDEAAQKIGERRRADYQDLVPSPYGLDDMPAHLTAPYRPGGWAGMQGGTGDVRYTPVDPTRDYPYSTDYEFIHRKEPDDEQGHDLTDAQIAAGMIGGSYKTIGVEIDGKETEIPMWQGQDAKGAEEMARMRLEWGLSPFATDQELEAVQNAAHQGPDDATMDPESPNYTGRPGYAQGTNNVGLRLFMAGQGQRRKKRKI